MATTKAHTNDDRPARLLKALPKHKTIKAAMLDAGYSRVTAEKQPGITLQRAIDNTTDRALNGSKTALNLLNAIGITREQVEERTHELMFNSNQHNVSAMMLAPALKAMGYDIGNKGTDNTAPQINIGIITAQPQGETATAYIIAPPAVQ